MNALCPAIARFDVVARLSLENAEAASLCPNVRTERRSGKPLTVETLTDPNGARFDFCLVNDRATVALAINFHTFLPQIPRCGER
jgi:hypothetical protein